jgi:hypothetical protein
MPVILEFRIHAKTEQQEGEWGLRSQPEESGAQPARKILCRALRITCSDDRTAIINTPGGGASRNVRRPDLVPGVSPFLDSGRQFLNPAAFAIPMPGAFGNLQRGLLMGRASRSWILLRTRASRLAKARIIEFRAELFNILNHANFANPNGTLPNALGTDAKQIQPGQPFTSAAAGVFGALSSTVTRAVGLWERTVRFNFRCVLISSEVQGKGLGDAFPAKGEPVCVAES